MAAPWAPSASVYITSGPPSADSVVLYIDIYYIMACSWPEDLSRQRPALQTHIAAVGVLPATSFFLLKGLNFSTCVAGRRYH